MLETAIRYVCHACGAGVKFAEAPFLCPNARRDATAGDGDHVLRRMVSGSVSSSVSGSDGVATAQEAREVFLDPEPNPFRRYAPLSYSHHVAVELGLTEADYLSVVDRLDGAIVEVDGGGFRETPFEASPQLAAAIGLGTDQLWVKDETGNVSGSHKARHLMGVMIWHEVQREGSRSRGESFDEAPLGIASCGNAALAAGVMARAAERSLEVFVPPEARPSVVDHLETLGATITRCPRRASDPPGDPCYLRFTESTEDRLQPFTVQGNQCGLAVEGGATLGWEIVSSLLKNEIQLDHLIVQVGGGGLASACIQAFRESRALGLVDEIPRIHTVQTQGGFPLRRAYDRIVRDLEGDGEGRNDSSAECDLEADPGADDTRARSIRDDVFPEELADRLRHAATHRSDYMWSWETPPKSIAYGILDDETYDWIAVLEGMLESGGIPLVVSEERLHRAHVLAREHTESPVEPTGTAGLAGLLALSEAQVIAPGESVAVLFTGRER